MERAACVRSAVTTVASLACSISDLNLIFFTLHFEFRSTHSLSCVRAISWNEGQALVFHIGRHYARHRTQGETKATRAKTPFPLPLPLSHPLSCVSCSFFRYATPMPTSPNDDFYMLFSSHVSECNKKRNRTFCQVSNNPSTAIYWMKMVAL